MSTLRLCGGKNLCKISNTSVIGMHSSRNHCDSERNAYQSQDSLCPSPRQVDVCSHWQVGRNLGKLESRQQSMWANSKRSRDSRESGRGSSSFAGARLSLRSQVLIPNSRCQKLLLQQLTNKSFISGYLRKWRVLTCPRGQETQSEYRNAARLVPAICCGWLLTADPSWRPAWSNVLCGRFLFIPWKDNIYFNARAWGGVQFWEDHSQQALQY